MVNLLKTPCALAFRQSYYFFGLPGSDLDETWWKWIPPLPCSFFNGGWEENFGKIDEKSMKINETSPNKIFFYFLWPPKG